MGNQNKVNSKIKLVRFNKINLIMYVSCILIGIIPLLLYMIVNNLAIARSFSHMQSIPEDHQYTTLDLFLSVKNILKINGALVLALTVITIIVLSIVLKRFIQKPMNEFRSQIVRMTGNKMLEYVDMKGPDEIMDMAAAFNLLVNSISVQKEDNESLRAELEYDKLKTDFMANISHEFRTPLNIMLSTLQLLELDMKDATFPGNIKSITKYTMVIKQNCYRLLKLLNNLIDMVTIDSESFDLNFQNHDIVSVVENITMATSEFIESRGITLEFDTDVEEKILACDSDQIERVILNLLSNGAKCTGPGGKICVNIKDGPESVTISVKDTGVGIPQEQLSKIFDQFRQTGRLFTRNHEGIGLGLCLVKCIIEMHGGKIRANSEYGKGSKFIIELPVKMVYGQDEQYIVRNLNIMQDYTKKINVEFSDIY